MSTIELELSDEEKAQLLTSLAVGLSDSSLSNEVSSLTEVTKTEKKTFFGPPRPVDRDAMGRYIPKPGGKPLSVFDEPGPGPDHYYPDYAYVLKKFPEYSMGESGAVQRGKKKGTPAPNKYNLRTSLLWGRCKTITFKEKPSTIHRANLGPGPAVHSNLANSLGGRKPTMGGRPKNGAMHGLVSSLVKNPDPTIPGPKYSFNRDGWLDKPVTFGTKTATPKTKEKIPGPSDYLPKVEPSGPKWKIASRRRDDTNTQIGPGPANYRPKPLVPNKRGVIMGIKHATIKDKTQTPGPNEYNKERKILTDPGYTLQYRWYDTETDKTPGPGHYSPEKDLTLASSPAFTIRKPWSKAIPDAAAHGPGPDHYYVSAPPLDKGKSIGLRYKDLIDANPSPGSYYPEKSDLKRLTSAPAYSITGRHAKLVDDLEDVGPGSYDIPDYGASKPAKSFGIRHHSIVATDGPGPAQPAISDRSNLDGCRSCECDRFVTVKSRHTPTKYSGFRDINSVEKPRADIPAAPLLG